MSRRKRITRTGGGDRRGVGGRGEGKTKGKGRKGEEEEGREETKLKGKEGNEKGYNAIVIFQSCFCFKKKSKST